MLNLIEELKPKMSMDEIHKFMDEAGLESYDDFFTIHASWRYRSGPTWSAIEYDALRLTGQSPAGFYGIFRNGGSDYVVLVCDETGNNPNRPNVHYTAPSVLFVDRKDAEAFIEHHGDEIYIVRV